MTGYVDAGLLDQRVTLYRYEATVSSRGTPIERYPEEAERWCRLEPATGREVTIGLKEDTRVEAVMILRDDIEVGNHWLAKVGLDLYRVLAPLPRRAQGVKHYLLGFAADANPTIVES